MGTYTANYQLYMPSIGEQGWGDLMNGNLTTMDTTMKSLSNRITAVENEVNGALSCTSVTTSGTITSAGKVTANGGVGTTSLTTSSTITSTGLITGNGGFKGNLIGNITGDITGDITTSSITVPLNQSGGILLQSISKSATYTTTSTTETQMISYTIPTLIHDNSVFNLSNTSFTLTFTFSVATYNGGTRGCIFRYYKNDTLINSVTIYSSSNGSPSTATLTVSPGDVIKVTGSSSSNNYTGAVATAKISANVYI